MAKKGLPVYSLISVLFVILLASCSEEIPSESNARSVFENIRSKQIKEGILKIDSFSKTNGQKINTFDGVEAYKVEYNADVTYPKGILPECVTKDFNWPQEIFWKCQDAMNMAMTGPGVSGNIFRQPGQKETIRGELLFENTEKGWKGEDGKIYLGVFGLGEFKQTKELFHRIFSGIGITQKYQIAGDWILRREDEPNSNPVAWMKIELDGTRIVVHGDSWSGEGSFDEQRGFYNWRFSDGRSGLTEFFFDNGIIHGKVRGSGISWDYQGNRK